MNYWTGVMMNEAELTELVEGDHDLPYALWDKLNRHLEGVREKLAQLEAAQSAPAVPNVDWDTELGDLLKWGGA